MALLKQSTAYTRAFLLVQSSDHITGLTAATPIVNISKAGAAFAAAAGVVTEIANGWYKVALTTADTGTLGDLAFHITATSADPTDFVDQVVVDIPGGSVSSVTGAVGSVTGNVGGNVVGSVASVTAGVTVSTNNDKTGYSLSQTFPTNFSSLAITAGGAVTAGTVSDKTGYSLSAAGIQAIWDALTSALTTIGSIGKLLVSNIDAAVSSRLASSSYSAPDNATIATINSNVDATVSSRATPAQILTTALTEAYSTKGASMTLSEALYEIVAYLDNRAISSTTETIYKRDGLTAAKTLTLNDAASPTSTSRAT